MKIKRLLSLLLLAFLLFTGCRDVPGDDVVTDDTKNAKEADVIKISSIYDLNLDPETLDSHAAEYKGSSLEMDFRSFNTLRATATKTTAAYYPRVTTLADGSYMMFYQDGRWGPNVMCMTSTDLVSWSSPKFLFSALDIAGDRRNFATADAVLLDNGDILVACCYRSNSNYTTRNDLNGLAMRKSSDNGATWSDVEYIYTGTAWEPSLIQTGSGEIQIYFTHVAPYIALYGYNSKMRSSGSAIIRSLDNGKTWTPDVKEAPYEAYRVMQSYIGDLDGKKYFNDQMPVALILHDGSIAVAAESAQLNGTFHISLAYNNDNWSTPLAIDEEGPADRITNYNRGVAPYLSQFKSGETILTYSSTLMYAKIGDSKARTFGAAYAPFDKLSKGLWSQSEILDDHTVLFVTDYIFDSNDNASTSLLTYGKLILNHRINAKKMTAVIDGDNSDWQGNTDALFVGSVSQAQVSVRCGHDDVNLYLLAERLDEYIARYDDEVLIFISPAVSSGKFYKIIADFEGVTDISYYDGSVYSRLALDNISSASKVNGSVGDDSDIDVGYVAEIGIPKSLIEGLGSEFSINIILKNSDKGEKFANDSFSLSDQLKPETWLKVVLD